jgi:GH15 family glucan-1,4-alpha-glucosidase
MASRIEDYALIGDCETAALVARNGSIDWLCFPRFDSGACFAALLGTPENGRWSIAPVDSIRSIRRKYREGTLILETEFVTDEGSVMLTDWMPPRSITSAPDVARLIEGKRGRVRMGMELVVRFDYGSRVPWVRRIETDVLRLTAGPDSLQFRAGVEVRGEDMRTVADFTVVEGQRIPFRLSWYPTYGEPPSLADANRSLSATETWWREWSGLCTYDQEWREAVVRSFITRRR